MEKKVELDNGTSFYIKTEEDKEKDELSKREKNCVKKLNLMR